MLAVTWALLAALAVIYAGGVRALWRLWRDTPQGASAGAGTRAVAGVLSLGWPLVALVAAGSALIRWLDRQDG